MCAYSKSIPAYPGSLNRTQTAEGIETFIKENNIKLPHLDALYVIAHNTGSVTLRVEHPHSSVPIFCSISATNSVEQRNKTVAQALTKLNEWLNDAVKHGYLSHQCDWSVSPSKIDFDYDAGGNHSLLINNISDDDYGARVLSEPYKVFQRHARTVTYAYNTVSGEQPVDNVRQNYVYEGEEYSDIRYEIEIGIDDQKKYGRIFIFNEPIFIKNSSVVFLESQSEEFLKAAGVQKHALGLTYSILGRPVLDPWFASSNQAIIPALLPDGKHLLVRWVEPTGKDGAVIVNLTSGEQMSSEYNSEFRSIVDVPTNKKVYLEVMKKEVRTD